MKKTSVTSIPVVQIDNVLSGQENTMSISYQLKRQKEEMRNSIVKIIINGVTRFFKVKKNGTIGKEVIA